MDTLIIYVLIINAIFRGTSEIEENKQKPYKLYRIFPHSNEDMKVLKSMRNLNLKLNFWKKSSKVNIPWDVMVPPNTQAKFENMLHYNNIEFTVIMSDVQKLIKNQKVKALYNNNLLRDFVGSAKNGPKFNFHQYQGYNDMTNFMSELEKNYPQICKVYTIGNSVENRPIRMIKIGYPINSETKKAIWIDAGVHAREWVSHSTAMYFINELVTKYNTNTQITQYVKNLTWYITPVVNPDGYEYSRSKDDPAIRLWRKNRSGEHCVKGSCCPGVDINRNFDDHWGEYKDGASIDPCDEDYQGPSAFSEPETRAVRDAVISRQNQIQAFITLHSYSEIWVHPWGFKKNYYPKDISELRTVASQAVSKLKGLYGTQYKVESGANSLYITTGASDDWAKSKGIKYVYLLELRPGEDNSVDDSLGFILSPNEIIPTGRETFEGIKAVADTLLKKNGFKLVG